MRIVAVATVRRPRPRRFSRMVVLESAEKTGHNADATSPTARTSARVPRRSGSSGIVAVVDEPSRVAVADEHGRDGEL